MTSTELKELVKKHFSLVEAPTKFADENTPRTEAEEEGYKDGMEDMLEDVKEAIASVKEEMADLPVDDVDAVEEEAEEPKEVVEMEATEPGVTMEDVVKAIGDIVSTEMAKMEEKYNALAKRFEEVSMEPAAEKTILAPKDGTAKVETFKKFSVENAANAKQIQMALQSIKNKK